MVDYSILKSRRRHNWKSAQVVSPSVWPHNPATRFRPPSTTVVSAEPFSHRTGTLRCLQKEMATYRHWSVSLWRDPDDVSHCRILSPDKTEWQLTSATLCGRTKTLFRGLPVMVHDMHTWKSGRILKTGCLAEYDDSQGSTALLRLPLTLLLL